MPFNSTNPVIVGGSTRKSDFDRAFNNCIALKLARLDHALGGDFQVSVADITYVPVPGFIVLELGGLTIEVQAMCRVTTGTGRFRLWNITISTSVAASETLFIEVTPTLKKSSTLTLASGVNTYRLEVRGADSADLPFVYGAKLVMR